MAILDFLGGDLRTAALFILLLVAFVVAFKVMQMVFETILVSVLSGGFYLGMVYFFGYSFAFERLLLFAFLGATLYMAYSFLISAYSVASTVLEVPYHIIKPLVVLPVKWGKKAYVHVRRKWRLYRMQQGDSTDTGSQSPASKGDGGDDDGDSSGDVKEVVLDKVKKS
ncbi:MAG: hypothetical protein ABEJ91_02230 [Candidatus Nanohaloarchaea archaeon]